jgi:hypothetical protein
MPGGKIEATTLQAGASPHLVTSGILYARSPWWGEEIEADIIILACDRK